MFQKKLKPIREHRSNYGRGHLYIYVLVGKGREIRKNKMMIRWRKKENRESVGESEEKKERWMGRRCF